MPVEIERLEPDIFLLHWIGDIGVKDLAASHAETTAITTADGIDRYVHIISTAELGKIPADAIGARQVLIDYSNVIALLMIDSPTIIRILTRTVNSITPQVAIETHSDLEAAKARAYTLLGRDEAQEQV
ncbi:MAG: hypothetical protein AAF125_16805 [Chloroflexota bacterium]